MLLSLIAVTSSVSTGIGPCLVVHGLLIDLSANKLFTESRICPLCDTQLLEPDVPLSQLYLTARILCYPI